LIRSARLLGQAEKAGINPSLGKKFLFRRLQQVSVNHSCLASFFSGAAFAGAALTPAALFVRFCPGVSGRLRVRASGSGDGNEERNADRSR
jgi:hypothetical protein